jgi:hypothetical protein
VTYGDSQAQCLLTDGARAPLQRFRDFDHRRLALRVSLKIANVFLRPGDTLSSFGHQNSPCLSGRLLAHHQARTSPVDNQRARLTQDNTNLRSRSRRGPHAPRPEQIGHLRPCSAHPMVLWLSSCSAIHKSLSHCQTSVRGGPDQVLSGSTCQRRFHSPEYPRVARGVVPQ